LAERDIRIIDHAAWQRIDPAERAAAVPGRPRRKFATLAELLSC